MTLMSIVTMFSHGCSGSCKILFIDFTDIHSFSFETLKCYVCLIAIVFVGDNVAE